MQLQKATRKKVKLRLGLSAVSGGGKTYSALKLAKGLVGDWNKIAVIDTENGSASLYSNLGDFNTVELSAPFSPERYIQAIKTCEDAGMECIIIDSITHEWDGKGGCLEIADQVTQASTSKNSYTAWAKVTPRHQAFIDAILQSKCHVITTVRRKQDYDMVKEGNKTQVVKVGLKEVTREGFEYEVTINFNLETSHYCTASKDRTGLFMDKQPFIITEETGGLIKNWCENGVDQQKEDEEAVQQWIQSINNCTTEEELKKVFTEAKTMAIKYPAIVQAKDAKKATFESAKQPA
ncbi:AAA family ATPase [Lacibacter sp. MH-610]|uniref:AAA family ATPase n=1 Tax=Lacibacter sp. MH-610 TaxID=3020883 RepID=UPI003891D2C3